MAVDVMMMMMMMTQFSQHSQSVGWSKKSNVHMTKILTTRSWLADLNDETTTDE